MRKTISCALSLLLIPALLLPLFLSACMPGDSAETTSEGTSIIYEPLLGAIDLPKIYGPFENPIQFYYPGADIEVSAQRGQFLLRREDGGEMVSVRVGQNYTLKNEGQLVWLMTDNSGMEDHVTVKFYENGRIVGVAAVMIIKSRENPPSNGNRLLSAAGFPKLGGEYQDITEEYADNLISEIIAGKTMPGAVTGNLPLRMFYIGEGPDGSNTELELEQSGDKVLPLPYKYSSPGAKIELSSYTGSFTTISPGAVAQTDLKFCTIDGEGILFWEHDYRQDDTVKIIIKENGHITGAAALLIEYIESSGAFGARLLWSAGFPTVDGRYQSISDKFAETYIQNAFLRYRLKTFREKLQNSN